MIDEVRLEKKTGSFRLGAKSLELSILSNMIKASSRGSATSELRITVDDQWLDLSMLCYITQLLQEAKSKYERILLRTPEFRDSKIRFLHRLGFWGLVESPGKDSGLICEPNPLIALPANIQDRLSYTPIITCSCDIESKAVKGVINRFGKALREASVYPLVAETDAMWSREYLFLLIWELLNNARQHSHGSVVGIAAQLFIAPDETSGKYDQTRELGIDEQALKVLGEQHRVEIENNILPQRRIWLSRRRDTSFMLISCADIGIGIPDSLRNRGMSGIDSDIDALKSAFDPDNSLGMNNPELYDVHGLSQVLRLIQQYNGYLFVQSGAANLDADCEVGRLDYSPLSQAVKLDGTIVQILLPLESPTSTGAYVRVSRAYDTSRSEPQQEPEPEVLRVLNEIQSTGQDILADPELWPDFTNAIVTRDSVKNAPLLYVDFLCVPRQRQFTSYLLRSLRRIRLLKNTIVINASPELIAVAESLMRLDREMYLTQEELADLGILDGDLATALTRGETELSLPLMLPFISFGEGREDMRLAWLGLSGLGRRWRAVILIVLEHLFQQSQPVLWEELTRILGQKGQPVDLAEEPEFKRLVHCLSRCNQSMLGADAHHVWLTHGQDQLRTLSYYAMKWTFEQNVFPGILHEKAESQQSYLYSRAWHKEGKRFSKRYYRTWPKLADKEVREFCALLMIAKAYMQLGEKFSQVGCVVSVTPSAGLIGRSVADMLGAAFCEAPSIYEIDEDEWPLASRDTSLVVVDDMIDTGHTTRNLLDRLKDSEHVCVLSLLESEEGKKERTDIECDVLAIHEVSVGIPSEEEVEVAIKNEHYFETDPHTLEPIPPHSAERFMETHQKDILNLLVSGKAIVNGHIVYSGHHYEIYFSLPDALANEGVRARILNWVVSEIMEFTIQCKKNARSGLPVSLSIVYPYYSPIDRLIRELRTEKFADEMDGVTVRYVVAQPYQMSGQRTGYRVAQSDDSAQTEALQIAVFLDDGIASGGTMAGIIDELVDMKVSAICALILFDRIGLQPRKHIARIAQYSYGGQEISFRFKSFVSANLKSYFRNNCPQCRLADMLRQIPSSRGLLSVAAQELRKLLRRTVAGSWPTEGGLFSENTLMQILEFHNGILSDTPSPLEIEKSLDDADKSLECRLECLRTILMDRKLSRQLINRKKYTNSIREILGNPKLLTKLRARFILFISLWEDRDYAYKMFTEILPEVFSELSENDSAGRPMLNRYFQKNGFEFNSVLVCAYLLRQNHPKPFDKSKGKWLEEWSRILSRGLERESPASIHLFSLRTLFLGEGKYGIEQAKYLSANFRGSYSEHRESMRQRIFLCRIELSTGRFDHALKYLPREIWSDLISHIRAAQELLQLKEFSDADMRELEAAYTKCCKKVSSTELHDLITKHFESEAPLADQATIRRLVDHFTPCTSDIVSETMKSLAEVYKADWENGKLRFEKRSAGQTFTFLLEIRIDAAVEMMNVLGVESYLSECISHLVQNAVTAWLTHLEETAEAVEYPIRVRLSVQEGQAETVEFRVIDDCPKGIENVEKLLQEKPFHGITVQRHMLGRWGSTIDPERIGGVDKAMVLRALQLDINSD